MARLCIVADEWLLNDLRGDNQQKAQQDAYRLLIQLREKCDGLAVLHDSPWEKKAYRLTEIQEPVRGLGRLLYRDILRNWQKCLLLYPNEVNPLPSEYAARIPRKDHYLVQTYLAAHADVLTTSDGTLAEALRTVAGINVVMRDEFLREYLAEGPA